MLFTGLFRKARKQLMTADTDMGMFRDKLNELVDQAAALSDEEVAAKVEELKGITADLPDDEGKEKLVRFLEDFKAVKEQDPAVAKKAAESVADEFEKLDTAAMQNAPADVPAEEPVSEEPALEEESVEQIAEETEEPLEEDADPNAEYSLEEIYQFIKKRMAEDAAAGTEEELPEEEPAAEEAVEEEEEEVVTDHAPHIPVTVKNTAGAGSLTALFNMAKGE